MHKVVMNASRGLCLSGCFSTDQFTFARRFTSCERNQSMRRARGNGRCYMATSSNKETSYLEKIRRKYQLVLDRAQEGRSAPLGRSRFEANRIFFPKNCNFATTYGLSNLNTILVPRDGGEGEWDENKDMHKGRTEIAVLGRSNVGKSSLLNSLFGTKEGRSGKEEDARTSKTPGRTQTLNYYHVGRHLALVDMPGYGYASGSKDTVQGLQEIIARYLVGRPRISCLLLLIDARRGLGKVDEFVLENLRNGNIPSQLVVTKLDKVSVRDGISLVEKLMQVEPSHPLPDGCPLVAPTSAKHGFGVPELRKSIAIIMESDQKERHRRSVGG
mmetsp:Transcript_18353/g.51785  ORF Transcript_18353/g.51785 Transcript_18353/m.51785 type:complete len:329 (+) Transcript_18353:110-1096(+)